MGFQFAETMAGTIEWDANPGVTHPFKFEVTAQAESTRAHFKDGRALLIRDVRRLEALVQRGKG